MNSSATAPPNSTTSPVDITSVPIKQTTIPSTLQTTTNVTVSPIVAATTTTTESDGQTVIIATAVPIGIILILVVVGAIVFYIRRRKTLKDKGQRLPIKSPDHQIDQNERDRPPLDVPLTTYEVINSGVNSPVYNNYCGLNPEPGAESNSRLRADSQSELYENTKPNSIVPPAESKTALVPKGWNVKPAKPSQAANPIPKTSRNPHALKPSESPTPRKPQKQDSIETPYYITVFPDPAKNSVAAHDKDKTNHNKNAAFFKGPKSKNKDKQKTHKQETVDVASPKKQPTVRQDSTLSTNYYNIEDDNSYQNVDVKLKT